MFTDTAGLRMIYDERDHLAPSTDQRRGEEVSVTATSPGTSDAASATSRKRPSAGHTAPHQRMIQWANHMRLRRMALLRSGARALIDRAEWEAEQLLHTARGAMLMGVPLLLIIFGHASIGAMLAAVAALGVESVTGMVPAWDVLPGSGEDWLITGTIFVVGSLIWVFYWRLIRRSQAWRWLRFPLIVFDAFSVLRMAVAIRGGQIAGTTSDFGVTTEQIGRLIPALFVLTALFGVLRLNPVTAALAGIASIAAQIALGAILDLPAGEIAPEIALLALTIFMGMQFVFVLRGMALKAAEEEVLERFVPQGLTQRLSHAGGTVPARITPVTILIADIRGFTRMSEPLAPEDAVRLLNDFFATMVEPLAAEDAVLDKYLGDGLLAFWKVSITHRAVCGPPTILCWPWKN